ncbi:MFS general substrate transporter [Lactarius pseudohatsudake]|nr:MFS general substrate transporter [Lactarius pseudohatsudake]
MRDDAAASEAPIVPPPSYDEPVVTRRELWSYYLYYNGDNAMTPARGPGSSCLDADASGICVLPWGSGTKAVSSVVLVANGASLLWLLLVVTLICWAAQFASMTPSRWGLAMGLYMVAIFPRLARNTQHTRNLRERYDRGEISAEVHEQEESLEKNRISNIKHRSNIGFIVTLGLNLSLLLPLQSNPKVNNYVIVFTNGYWVLTGIWWFIYQQPRPGPKLPRGESYLTVGWKQIWVALKQYKKLPYTFTYLFAFFLLADGLNTTGTLVAICQNDKFTFSFLQNTYLGLAQAITSTASTLGFWYIQTFGFHNVWEFWAYNVVFGLFQAPYFAFSQTMMAELSPPGFDNMFFGLFGLSNRASSMIGRNVIQAIINKSGNNWDGFPFLFALCAAASLVIWFGVDVQKGRRAAVMWAAERRGYISKLKQLQGRDTAMET